MNAINDALTNLASGKGESRTADSLVLRVQDLSKCFKVYTKPANLIKEILFRKPYHEERWALRDISLDIFRGEIVGLVGGNGAGKSTLLRILAGVLDQTTGHIQMHGQLRAILELGTGFHDQYSGLENIYMGGYCLGYSKPQIDEVLDWIIDFSGLRAVIHQPFRTYSSGMKARLTFAVTFCRQPEMLIVDEALAVGDMAFTNKCVNRIVELCSHGSTALVVSHNLLFIERLCNRALYLQNGRLLDDGPPRRICKRFEEEMLEEFKQQTRDPQTRPADSVGPVSPPALAPQGNEAEIQHWLDDPEEQCPPLLHLKLVRLESLAILDKNGLENTMFHVGEPVRVRATVDSLVEKTNVVMGIQIFHESGIHVFTTTTQYHLTPEGRPQRVSLGLRKGRQSFEVSFPGLFLGDGKYYVSFGIAPKDKHFSPADLLLQENRCAVFGMRRDDVSLKQIYDPPSRWYAAEDCLPEFQRVSA